MESVAIVSPIRVLMAVPQYPYPVVGGLEKQAHALARELLHRGHQVMVLSGRIAPKQPDLSLVDGIVVHRISWTGSRFLRWCIGPLAVWLRIRKLMRQVDVVHAHVISGFGLYVILLARLYQKPVQVKLANDGVDGLPGLARGLLGALRVRVFFLADGVVAMSGESLSELRSVGFDRRRVLATPNGIRMQPNPRIANVRIEAETVCRFVFAGRLHQQKGLLDLLAAVRRLLDEMGPARFTVHLLGDGPERAAVERYVEEFELARVVELRGHVEEVPVALVNYDAFVMPSFREGNSNAVLEAMAAGLPIISTRVGGTPLLVGPAGEDLLHEAGDVEGLARLMRMLIVDVKLRAEKGRAMRQRVRDRFDMSLVAATYVRAYRLLIAGRREGLNAISNVLVN